MPSKLTHRSLQYALFVAPVLWGLITVGCVGLNHHHSHRSYSKRERRVGAGLLIAGLVVAAAASGADDRADRKRVRAEARRAWNCHDAMEVNEEFERGDQNVFSVRACGRYAWFECGNHSCRMLQSTLRAAAPVTRYEAKPGCRRFAKARRRGRRPPRCDG